VNALHDVATVTRIPFLSSVCTLSLAIIPMVQVRRSGGGILVLSDPHRRPLNFKKTDASG
jgi:hypothetical protein